MKVDNIYDCPTAELLKKDIISDLSRIIGLVPGKRGNIDDIIPDKIFVLTDADQLVCLQSDLQKTIVINCWEISMRQSAAKPRERGTFNDYSLASDCNRSTAQVSG